MDTLDQIDWLRVALTTVGDAVVAADRDGWVTFLNPAAAALTGWSPEEAIGRPLDEIVRTIPEGTPAIDGNPLARVLANGAAAANHSLIVARDGATRAIAERAAPIRDGDGNLAGVVLILRDISEQQNLERRRNARLAIIQVLAQTTTAAEIPGRILRALCTSLNWDMGLFWDVDSSAEVLRCREVWRAPSVAADEFEAMSRQIAFTPGVGLPGRVWSTGRPAWIPDVVHDTNFPRAAVAQQANLHGGFGCPVLLAGEVLGVMEFFSQEIREPDADLLETAATIGSQIGQFLQRKRTEEEARASEVRLRLALEAGRMGTWDWDCCGNRITWSASLEAIHGLAPGTFPGTFEAYQNDIHPDDRERVLAAIAETLEQGEEYRIEYRLLRPDGALRWVEARGRLFRDAAGRPRRMTGVCMDATERKQAEEEIRQLNETLEHRVHERTARLEEANRELESFSYSVSHDLRAPLRHISGFLDLLQRSAAAKLNDNELRYLRIVLDSARRAGQLVDELLAFSRMGRAEMRQMTVPLSQVVDEVRRELESETEERDIDWQVGPLPEVQADPAMLRLVVRNLLSNAVKYTRPRARARIEIGSRAEAGELIVWVRDNGVGFDMQYQEKLFGVFQRLHTPEDFEGTGIGLANVRRIIQRHGGRTWAEGVVDGGATFYFTLPRDRAEKE